MSAPYAHIACCVDTSDAARAALAEARGLRSLSPGKLSVVHTLEWPQAYLAFAAGFAQLPPLDALQAGTTAWLKDLAGVDAEPVLLEGHPASTCCDWADNEGVDLLVAASHRGIFERALLGSFATFIARHAPCPVLLVPPHRSDDT